jgi:hypothetical protein
VSIGDNINRNSQQKVTKVADGTIMGVFLDVITHMVEDKTLFLSQKFLKPGLHYSVDILKHILSNTCGQ